jgi:hypothetical protein
MALTPYPTSLAPEDWTVVIDALKGNFDGTARMAHCVYDAIGFALGQLLPDTAGMQAVSFASHPMKAELAAVGAIDWKSLLALLIKLLPLVLPFLNPTPAA